MKQQRTWTGTTGGGTFGQRALVLLFRALGVKVLYAVMALVVPFYMLLARRRCAAIYRYFRQQWGCTPARALLRTYRNHYVFGQCMLDRFAVYAGRSSYFSADIEGNEQFMQLLGGERGFIMASAHVGNLEMGAHLLAQVAQGRKRINAMVFGGESEEVMRQRERTLHNVRLLSVSPDLSHVFYINEALTGGEIVSMPADRNFGSPKSVACRFLNGTASFPQGAFAMAVHFDVPLLSFFVMKESTKRYRIFAAILYVPDGNSKASRAEKIQGLAQRFAGCLSDVLKRYPEQWFNFYDFWN